MSSRLTFVDPGMLERTLSMVAAIDALERAFGADVPADAPPRSHVLTPDGDLLLMPAMGAAGTGVKLVTVPPSNQGRGLPLVQGVYVLFEPGTLRPVALIDGSALTALRTAAVTGVATRHLARPDAHRLLLFGAGGRWRPAFGPSSPRPARSPGAWPGRTSSAAAPSARCPCFDGAGLSPGVHVNAVGSYRPEARELDDETVRRGRVVVETREAALTEAGDLVRPLAAGVIDEDSVASLTEVVRGMVGGRAPGDITVFKSVGVAFEDLVVARATLDALQEAGA